jgi:carboxymethylenebutenolidase
VQEIIQAAAVLRSTSRKRFGVVGFSLGGYWALWLADQKASPVAATVVFYGSRSGNYAASRAAFQFHRAESDDYVSVSGVKKLAKALETARRPAKFYTYPNTTHWFFERDREAYDAEAADLAWHRTVEFLKKHVAEGRQKDKR